MNSWHIDAPSTSVVYVFRGAIDYLSEESVYRLNQELGLLSREDVGALLHGLDNDFAAPSVSTDVIANKYYFSVRSVLVQLPGQLKDGLTFAQAAAPYILNKRRWRRNNLPPANLPPELGQISHSDRSDLWQQAEKSLKQRQRAIEQAAENDIRTYEMNFGLHAELLAEQPCKEMARAITAWTICANENDETLRLPPCTPRQFASVMLCRLREEPPKFNSSGWPLGLRLPRSTLEWEQLPGAAMYRHQFEMWPWFFIQHRLPNAVLTAIFVLLLCHTGWNPGSVGSLTVDSITPLPQGGYQLQSYKSKTDDQTPVSEVRRSQTTVCKAIDLLLWNYRQLCHFGLIKPSQEKRVWFGWQRDSFKTTVDAVSNVRIRSLCTRNEIPSFLLSEIRPIRAALTYLPQRDLESVRVLLGHVDLVTSDSYLENTLFFRLNEAMMLEFQRRIEATLTYALGGEKLLMQRSIATRHVDKTLFLVPTGDGGACANLFAGNDKTYADSGEPCAGLACHSGGGCEHYRLVISESSLEAAMRSRIYYRARWKKLYEINPLAFKEMHLPKLLYTFVLLRIAKEQRPDLYSKAEMAIV